MRMRRINSLLAIAVLLLITGCIVEERMFWSPDGRRAAVRLPEGLCLMDVNGQLSAPLISEVTFAAWLPDSRGLVILRRPVTTNWQEIRRLVPGEESAPVEALAAALPALISGALDTAGGDVAALEEKFFKPLKLELDRWLVAGLICLRDTQPEAFGKLLGRVKGTDQLQKELAEACKAIVQEICVLRLDGDKPAGSPLVLARTLAELGEPRPSPSAPVVAFLRDDVLTVAPLDGHTNRVTVSHKTAGSYDWTPDGKALVFAVRLSEKWERDTINLAHIQRRVVVGASGAPMEGDRLLLGTGAFTFTPRVRSLHDGRVLFASQPLQLPANANSMNEARFYVVDPARGTNAVPVAVSSESGALPADLAAFAVSPDGRHVAIGESGSDAVAVLEIATGRLDVISPKRGAQNRTLPAWRGNDELYLAALPKTGARRAEWLRWRKGSTPQVFSGGWPDTAVQQLVGNSLGLPIHEAE